ncbi:MAG: phosphatidate cytidylyltransferase [Planctomycetes bacterium]|nr:phosphatidate cytidylyltransferase [Planctomycetota bacterium]
MLKHRLLFGSIMAAVFVGLILLDGYLDGSLTKAAPNQPVQAMIFTILIALLAIPAQFELGNLIKQTGGHLFKIVTIPASILLATAPFWLGWINFEGIELFLLLCLLTPAFSFLALFIVQALKFGTEGTVRNVSGSFFSIIYLGFLCSFILGIRIAWGPWVLLTFIFTVKGSDIGAYTLGRLFGKHKMCPTISPGKTWEGLAGAALFGVLVSFGFSVVSGIMTPLWAIGFGAVFGILGQMGDLVESMIKRDAASKDSSASIPGFGGILDVIDSPLATAPAAFAFFYIYEQLLLSHCCIS